MVAWNTVGFVWSVRLRCALVPALILTIVSAACGLRSDSSPSATDPIATAPVETAATGSVYRIEAEPCLGLRTTTATAFALEVDDSGRALLATAAHPFERTGSATVHDKYGRIHPASVVYLDADIDIALLRIADDRSEAFILDNPKQGVDVEVRLFASDDGPRSRFGTIARLVTASLDGRGRRAAVELQGLDIEQGDSGAPVITEDGRAVAMVFAASKRDDTGWATSSVELQTALETLDPSAEENLLSCRD